MLNLILLEWSSSLHFGHFLVLHLIHRQLKEVLELDYRTGVTLHQLRLVNLSNPAFQLL